MIPYIAMMVLSCTCFYIAYNTKIDNELFRRIWILFGILIPCFLAAFRDVSVGTDVLSYVVKTVDYAETHSLKELIIRFTAPNIPEIEPLYLVVTFIISLFTNSISTHLFVIELVCVLFVYKTFKEIGFRNKMWFGFFIYYTLFYGFSLNLMRQVIVMCFLLWGLCFIKKRQYIRAVILCAILMMIHRTGIIGFVVYALYPLITAQNIKNKVLQKLAEKNRILFDGLLIIVSAVVVRFAGMLITIISALTGSFQYQALHVKSYFTIIPSHLIMMSIIILVSLIFIKSSARMNREIEYYCVLSILAVILWQVQGVSRESYRIALYFWIFVLPYLVSIVGTIRKKSNAIIIEGIFCIIAFVYFYYFTVISGMNSIYPYTSTFLGIG